MTVKPVCKECKQGGMVKKGEQRLPSGKVLVGYHCQNPACKLYESWQTVEIKETK